MAQSMSDAVNYASPNWGGITTGGALVAMEADSGKILGAGELSQFRSAYI